MTNYIWYVLATAIPTYLLRMVPLVAIKKKITNPFLRSFLFYMPFAVLATMTFPAIIFSSHRIESATIATIVAIYFSYKEKKLLTVALLSCLTVFIVELFLH